MQGSSPTDLLMPAAHFIDSPEVLSAALATICSVNLLSPVLFVGLHGIRICRNGRLCILQLYVPPLDATFLIDVSTLDQLAFTAAAPPQKPGARHGPTLKYLLECPDIPKVFYDGNSFQFTQQQSMLINHAGSPKRCRQLVQRLRYLTPGGHRPPAIRSGKCLVHHSPTSRISDVTTGCPSGLEEIFQPAFVSPHASTSDHPRSACP